MIALKNKTFHLWYTDLMHLIYPKCCLACDNELATGESELCNFCDSSIVRTNFHLFQEPSDMDKLFWGRVQLEFTHAHLFFQKNTASQKILFTLKYKNNPRTGTYFGKRIGQELLLHPKFKNVDVIIPVPLHPKKKFIRGYNQSEAIAQGIGEATKKTVNTTLIKRIANNSSQTKKSRFERWDNVTNAFALNGRLDKFKHIVLVDDVITTGSTIEQIIQLIHASHPEIHVSVVTLAIA